MATTGPQGRPIKVLLQSHSIKIKSTIEYVIVGFIKIERPSMFFIQQNLAQNWKREIQSPQIAPKINLISNVDFTKRSENVKWVSTARKL